MTFVLAAVAAPAAAFFGAETQTAGQPGAFLRAAMNARPLAMGGAHTGVADDASAPFWNASGLAQIQRYDVVTYYSRLGDNASIGSGAFAVPTSRFGTFSLNYVSLQSGAFRRRDASNQDLGGFENKASALMLSQGFDLGGPWSAGYTVKAVRQDIERFSDTGYGADLGLLFRPHPRWQAGFALQNAIQPALRLRNEKEKLPTEARIGGKYDPIRNLTLAADASFIRRRSPGLNLGLEWRAAGPLALRVGANDREISSGFGLFLGDAGLDYAFGFPHGKAIREELGSSHRFSFHLRFGESVAAAQFRLFSARREERRQEIVKQDEGVDHVKVLRRRMESWDGQMNARTFGQVQAARRSLREVVFTSGEKSLEAQAYILHFQGHFEESLRLFDQLHAENPRNRRISVHRAAARRRMVTHPDQTVLMATYRAMDDRQQTLRREQLAAKARELEIAPLPPAEQDPIPHNETPAIAFLAAPTPAAPAATEPVEAEPTEPEPATAETADLKPEVVEARQQFAAGNYVQAHVITRRVLELDPDDRDAARQAILSNAVVSRESEFVNPEDRVDLPEIERQVTVSLQIFEKGHRLNDMGRREEALILLDEAINVCPANFLARDLIKKINADMEEERWRKILDNARGSLE